MKRHGYVLCRPKGFTLIEMLAVVFIISVLVTVAIPCVETSVKRGQELALRRALRHIRQAIDDYHHFVEAHKIQVDEDTYGYPPDLETLVRGIEYKDKKGNDRIRKFLRRIPRDPFTGSTRWGLRSYEDEPDSSYWGGDNVYDVYTRSRQVALDGTLYRDW